MGSIPGSGRSPGGGHSSPLQYCILAWRIPWTEEPGQTRLKRHKLMELPNTCHTCQFLYFSKKISYSKVFIFSVNFLQIFGLKSFLGIRIFWNHCIYLIFKIIFLIYICCWIELQVTFYVDFISLSLAKLT